MLIFIWCINWHDYELQEVWFWFVCKKNMLDFSQLPPTPLPKFRVWLEKCFDRVKFQEQNWLIGRWQWETVLRLDHTSPYAHLFTLNIALYVLYNNFFDLLIFLKMVTWNKTKRFIGILLFQVDTMQLRLDFSGNIIQALSVS